MSRRYVVYCCLADPDLQMSGGEGVRSKKFSALWASVWYKITLGRGGGGGGRGGAGAPLDRPLDVLGKFGAEVIT